MIVRIVRRWGPHQPGDSVTVDDTQGRWLVDNSFAERPGSEGTATAGSVAPGTNGADPRAGGDSTRRGPMNVESGPREGNRAAPAAGSPVQYNAGVAPTPPASSTGDSGSPDSGKPPAPSSKASTTGRRRPRD